MTQKQWDKLKPATKRVKIAQDVIDRINAKQYKARSGIWAKFSQDFKPSTALQPIIAEGNKCECCAVGSLLLSRIALGNTATSCGSQFIDYDGEKDDYYDSGASANDQSAQLRTVFPAQQLILMELAFELGDGNFTTWSIDDEAEGKRAISFGTKYKSLTGRLKAIMKNIITNKGTFKP